MLIKHALTWAHESLLLSSSSARLDAEVLLSYILKKPATFLLAHDDDEICFWKMKKYQNLIKKRKKGIPVAYLTGSREFFGLDFEVNRDVLVPRPDTEILVECVVEYIKKLRVTNDELSLRLPFGANDELLVLDIGTGSACIPISVLKNVADINAVATEISGSAMKVAKRNVAKHQLKSRIKLIKSDLLTEVPIGLLKDCDIVLTANLPYIPKQFQVDPSAKFEPDIALYGGDDGLDIYKRLIEELEEMEIKPKAMFFELFEFQIAALCENMPDYELKYAKDMTGDARCLMLERVD